ncbi:MAG TPA: hypothetical protein VMV38_01700 [Candidatus Paceibacterota bacterium]|nr:hypothetical protein [Candidatus Paceibacterota bacterium]
MNSSLTRLFSALAVAVMAVIGYGVWYSVVSAKSAEVANLQNQITTATNSVNHLTSDRTALTEITTAEGQIQSYFVPESGVVAFINYLQASGLTQKATVTVLSVSTGSSDTLPSLLFSLTIQGTFDSVMRTVGMIEYAPYDLSISSLSVKKNDKNTWQAALSFSVGSVPIAPAPQTP